MYSDEKAEPKKPDEEEEFVDIRQSIHLREKAFYGEDEREDEDAATAD